MATIKVKVSPALTRSVLNYSQAHKELEQLKKSPEMWIRKLRIYIYKFLARRLKSVWNWLKEKSYRSY